jgi:hypothetical protein
MAAVAGGGPRRPATSWVVASVLLGALSIAVLMGLLHPIPGAREYGLAIRLVVSLVVLWFVVALRPHWLRAPWFLGAVFVAGSVVAVVNLATLDADAEIVHVYQSTFDALDRGENPYTSEAIYHLDRDGDVVLGAFNYPPLELYPEYVTYRFVGRWNVGVLTAFIVTVNLVAAAVLVVAFRSRARYVLPWVPLLVFFEIKTNVSMTLLFVVLVLWAIQAAGRDPTSARRVLVAVLLGIGLTSKFLVIPVLGAYL